MKNLFTLFISLIFTCGVCYAQSISVFDVDTSSFPIMKAKILAVDAAINQVTNFNLSELSVTENGIPSEIISVTCPPLKPPKRISSTIVIDVSGSMSGLPLDIAKTMAKTWVNALPLGQSECALVSFNGLNYFNQDFTTNRNKLLSAIDGLMSDDGTDYNAALIDPVAGGTLTAKEGKYNKVIVFITDGLPNTEPDVARIVAEAKAHDIIIHCITISLPPHLSMYKFAEQTGGMVFGKVNSEKDAKTIANILLGKSVFNYEHCELAWKSDVICKKESIMLDIKWNSAIASQSYMPPYGAIINFIMKPAGIRFINKPIGIKSDTTIEITALHSDINISDIISSDQKYYITPSKSIIRNGETKTFTLSVTPTDSSSSFAFLDIINDKCQKKYYVANNYLQGKTLFSTLKLTSPNGGEEFMVGSDTVITWEGILPNDTVKLEYSYDNGATWNLITDSALGLKYVWKNVPRPESRKCLVRIISKSYSSESGVNVEWERLFGGSYEDVPKQIIETENGYIVVGETSSYDGDITDFYGRTDAWVLYLNKQGVPIWKKTFGASSYENGCAVKEMDDGGFVIGAVTTSPEIPTPKGTNTHDFWIIRLDINGKILWSKRYGGSSYDFLSSIEKTNDGGLVALGYSDSEDRDVSNNNGHLDAWILKLDLDGEIEWQKSLGGNAADYAFSIVQTVDNCFVIAGKTESNDGDISKNQGLADCWVAKVSFDGSLIWSKTFGGLSFDVLTSIKETRDFGFIVSGYSLSDNGDIKNNHGHNDALIAKLDDDGNLLWLKMIGGSGDDRANSIIETEDNGILFVGATASCDGDVIYNPDKVGPFHFWTVKLDNTGQIKWSKVANKYYSSWANSIQQTNDQGFITAGYATQSAKSFQDFYIIKFSPESNFLSDVSDSLFSIVAPKITALNIDMGQVVLGSYKDSVITAFIKNTSKYDCQINDISSASSDFYVISNPAFTLKGNTEQAIEIHFKPSKLGKMYSSINIVTQDTSFAQSIEGEGIQPTLLLSTNLIDFGKVNVKELKDTTIVLLENISGGSINISDVKLLGPDTKQFEILEGGGAFTLSGGSTRELKLRFKPVYIGRTSCMLGFYHNGANSPAKAQLYGQGIGGLVSVSDDSAYAGENVKINMVLSHIAPSSLQNVVSSFRAKLKYLTAPLTLVNTSLKKGETTDSTIIEVSGTIGADSILCSIDFTANDATKDFTTIDLEEIKWFDVGGNEIEYEAETQDGSFKLLKYLGMAKVYCTSDSALPGETASLKLKTFGIDPASFKEIAPKFKATLRYQKTLLATIDKSLTVNYVGDSAFVQVTGDVVDSDELASIDFIAGLGSVDSTTIDIVEIKWLNSKGEEVFYETHTEGGLFKLLGVCREGGARLFNAEGKAGIEELSPNPARDEINVTVNQTEEGDSYLIVYNILGNEVMREKVSGSIVGQSVIRLSLKDFSRGIYYVKYQSPTVTEVKSFIAD